MGRPTADEVRHHGTSGQQGRRWPAALSRVQRKITLWRQGHPPRSRLPETLWRQVAVLARGAGIARTAQTLRLDYYSVKKHVAALAAAAPTRRRTSSGTGAARVCRFVEVLPGGKPPAIPAAPAAPRFPGSPPAECLIELEASPEAKLRLRLQGYSLAELTTLTRAVWECRS
jgi:hypothetical protein